MADPAAWLLGLWQAQDPWEVVAVGLALAYLLLAMRESLWCWHAAFWSTAIYLVLFWRARLLMEAVLQLYYLGMAVYGWWQWRAGAREASGTLAISRRRLGWHLNALLSVLACAAISGLLLSRYSTAAWPYVDSFTTWGSLLATWMVARKLLENWLWWFLIDTVSLGLYIDRGLHLTAALFAVYLVIIVFGFLRWQRHFREQEAGLIAPSPG